MLHYTSPAPSLTKYDMTSTIAAALKLPIDHVIPDRNKPESKPGQTERPENTQLSVKSLKDIGVDTSEETGFEDWWNGYVGKKA
jgi:S-adenosylmethionine synthetase